MWFKNKALSWSLAGLLLALPIVWLVGMQHRAEINPYYLELTVHGVTTGRMRVDFDLGSGLRQSSPAELLVAWESPITHSFLLPAGPQRYCQGLSLHVEASGNPNYLVIKNVHIVDSQGNTVLKVPAQSMHVMQQNNPSQAYGDDAFVVQDSNKFNIFDVAMALAHPLALPEHEDSVGYYVSAGLLTWFICTLLVALAALALRQRSSAPDGGWMRVWTWAVEHPHTAIAAVGLAAVIASAYPVVLAGRSYDSPNMGTGLLYPYFPTVPGSHSTAQEDVRGSDVGATAWQSGPYAMIQHRAVFDDGEFPLWNRYSDLGIPFLGQGISMIFDPVHWITVLGNGAAWTWDLKFLIAKTLLAVGLGCLVFAATRFLPAALIVAASSVFIGFFIVRLNHPDFFSFCYAPLVLLAWVRIIQAATTRQRWPWMLVLAVATVMCFNSGAVKAGYLLCGAMHLAGVLTLLLDVRPLRERLKLLGVMSLLGLAILLITAPSYLTFSEALKQSVTSYDVPASVTIAPGAAIGSFEELFPAMMSPTHHVQFPTANLLLFLGLAWLLARPSVFRRNRLLVVLAVGAGAAFATAFGFVPEAWLSATPFIKNIQHIGYEFSEIFIIFGFVLAGCGLKVFWQRCTEPKWYVDYLVVLALLLFLVGIFMPALVLSGQLFSLDDWNVGLVLVALISAALLPLAARYLISGKQVAAPVVALVILCLLGIHGRYGLQLESGLQKLDFYVVNPQERPDFSVPSPAIQSLPDPSTQPFRAIGLGSTMIPGFNAALGLETVFGPVPLVGRRYTELIDGVGFEQNFFGWATFFTPENLQKHAAALDLLNVRYVLAPHTMGESVPGVVRTRADLDIVERPTAWPRAFFTDRLLEYRELPEFAGLLQNAKGRPFAAVQKGEVPAAVPLALSAADREARLIVPATAYRLTCNTTTFTVEAPKAGVAVLSEAFYPDDFQVTVNGRPAAYFRVNHAFKGVVLDGPGTYTIGFTYRPKVWSLCLVLLAIGLALLAALVIWQRRSRSIPTGGPTPPEATPLTAGTEVSEKAVMDNRTPRHKPNRK